MDGGRAVLSEEFDPPRRAHTRTGVRVPGVFEADTCRLRSGVGGMWKAVNSMGTAGMIGPVKGL